jgi:hypothetical protein
MKNVMIYNIVDHKRRHNNDELFKLFQSQIDNSLHYGWSKEDIIIGTNFKFEYKGIKSYHLTDICEFNIFNNKWYGMLELMKNGILNDDFWFHDQDNWQINNISFPEFEGEIGAATYVRTPEWNTSAVYVKNTSLPVLEYIVNSMKMNPIQYQSDENWIAFLRQNSEIKDYLHTLNTEYCVGYTYLDDRIKSANGPIRCLGFMPNTKSHEAFYERNLIPEHLQNIFENQFNTIKAIL